MQNPTSSHGNTGQVHKGEIYGSWTDRNNIPAVKFHAAGVAGQWQVLSRCHTGSLWVATGQVQAGLRTSLRLFDEGEKNWGRSLWKIKKWKRHHEESIMLRNAKFCEFAGMSPFLEGNGSSVYEGLWLQKGGWRERREYVSWQHCMEET